MITWKSQRSVIGPTSWAGYLGEVKVFTLRDGIGDCLILGSELPNCIQNETLLFKSLEIAQESAELLLVDWLRSAGLEPVAPPNLVALSAAYNRGYGEGKKGKDFPYAIALPCDELAQYRQGYAEGLATKHPD